MQQIVLSNPVAWAMFLICLLSVAFMFRFLGALVAEQKQSRSRLALRRKILQASRERIYAAPLHAAHSIPEVAPFSHRMARFGADSESLHRVATLEISAKW
jgi:biopolymer transport protein ExbB/TolQ